MSLHIRLYHNIKTSFQLVLIPCSGRAAKCKSPATDVWYSGLQVCYLYQWEESFGCQCKCEVIQINDICTRGNLIGLDGNTVAWRTFMEPIELWTSTFHNARVTWVCKLTDEVFDKQSAIEIVQTSDNELLIAIGYWFYLWVSTKLYQN